MVRFEELQELWQNQAAPSPGAFDPRGLTEELRRFGRRQTAINLLKVALMAWMFVRLMNSRHWTATAIWGTILMYSGVVTYLVLDWRNQIGISRLDFSASSVEFVRGASERLQHQLNPMRSLFWFFIVTIGGGFNLVLLEPHGASPAVLIGQHLTATALPFAAYLLGEKIREFRFRRECGAVLERVEALLRTMEQHSS